MAPFAHRSHAIPGRPATVHHPPANIKQGVRARAEIIKPSTWRAVLPLVRPIRDINANLCTRRSKIHTDTKLLYKYIVQRRSAFMAERARPALTVSEPEPGCTASAKGLFCLWSCHFHTTHTHIHAYTHTNASATACRLFYIHSVCAGYRFSERNTSCITGYDIAYDWRLQYRHNGYRYYSYCLYVNSKYVSFFV